MNSTKYTVFRSSASITKATSGSSFPHMPEYNFQAPHACPNLFTQGTGLHNTHEKHYAEIDRERTVVDLGSSASNYVADHLVGLGGEWQGAKNPSFQLNGREQQELVVIHTSRSHPIFTNLVVRRKQSE